MKHIPVVFLLALLALTACTTGPQASDCPSRIEILERLESVVPYDEFSLSFNTNKENSALTLWLVNPAMDSHTAEGLRDNIAYGLIEAAAAVHRMYRTDACVGELFDFINVILVDPDYVGMFSGVLSLDKIPDKEALSEDELVTLATSFEVDYRLAGAMGVFTTPPGDACTWGETRDKISRSFSLSSPNVDFFYKFDALGSSIWAQFVGPTETEPTGFAILKANKIIEALDCQSPPVNKITTIIVDAEGEVLLVGAISEADADSENAVNGFDINDFTFTVLLEAEEE